MKTIQSTLILLIILCVGLCSACKKSDHDNKQYKVFQLIKYYGNSSTDTGWAAMGMVVIDTDSTLVEFIMPRTRWEEHPYNIGNPYPMEHKCYVVKEAISQVPNAHEVYLETNEYMSIQVDVKDRIWNQHPYRAGDNYCM
jgi:hypothetical protein